MKAKDKHRAHLLKYMSDWNNPFPNRTEMAVVLGIKLVTLNFHFNADELNEILNEGLELRKKNSAIPRSEIYEAMQKAGKEGIVPAMKEFLDRTEGKIIEKIQHGFDEATLNAILNTLPPEQAEKTKAALMAIAKKK